MRIINFIKTYRYELANLLIGMTVLTFELTASRVVAPYIGATIQVWTSIIGVILASLAAGYWIGGSLADKRHRKEDVIWLLIAAAFLITAVNLFKDPVLAAVTASSFDLAFEAFWASLLLFAPPTIVLGAASPYILRLSITSVSTSGKHIGRIDAAGTFGSLIGTFATGYFLFGFIGTRYLLGCLAVLLVLATFLISSRVLVVPRLLILVVLLLAVFTPSNLRVYGLVKEVDTPYSRVFINEDTLNGQPARLMQFDDLGWQSGILISLPDELAFGYARGFAAATDLVEEPKRALVIGGGAFTFPRYLAENYPGMQVDVVEIDKALLDVSQEYFRFDPTTPNLEIYTADGREFINNTKQKYDLIFMDAFTSVTPPFQLLTKEAASHMKRALNKDGVVVVNVIAAQTGPRAAMAKAAENTYQTSGFQHTTYYRIGAQPKVNAQNMLLVASDRELPQSLNYESPAYQGVNQRFNAFTVDHDYQGIFTDDFAPVERLSSFR